MKPLKIGNVSLKNRIFLAPMVDVTDLPYRIICRKAGAGMAFTEMLNIGSILHENRKTRNMLKTSGDDKPSGVQITAPKVEDFKNVTGYLREFDIVDINCGCPSIRIMDNASGSYLLKTPIKIASYIRVLKKAGYIVTAKIRLGFKKNNVLVVAKAIQDAGADAITLHSRMSYDSYKVPADWKWIAEIKKKLKIPVIGNGDVDSGKKASEMLKLCDGVMIARAAIGDPHIFTRVLHYLNTGKEIERDFNVNMKYFKEYLVLAEKLDVIDIPRIKSLGGNFLRGVDGAAAKRAEFMQLKTLEDVKNFVEKLL